MMRLPPFVYRAPTSAEEAVRILHAEGADARLVAGGTDLLPNMKRRHQSAEMLVSTQRIDELKRRTWQKDGALHLGAADTLWALEHDARLAGDLPALHQAVRSISTPLLRRMGTIGGNVCLDTRCNYYDQNWEWRRAIDFCMKCDGTTCWVAPSSPRCWAVNSSDSVPVLIALGARARLLGPEGFREVPVADLFRDDGIDYLAKAPDELLVRLEIPPQGAARSVYRKVRRRGSFDFPVAAVAVRLAWEGEEGDPGRRVSAAIPPRIVLNAVGSAPVVVEQAAARLAGHALSDDIIEEVADSAWKPAKPLDNTDHEQSWRKKMIRVEIRRALLALRGDPVPPAD
jgi:4-hydroxybenzoyl-CoA reductase subunit beta